MLTVVLAVLATLFLVFVGVRGLAPLMGVHTGFGELVIRGEALDHFEFVCNSRRTEIIFLPGFMWLRVSLVLAPCLRTLKHMANQDILIQNRRLYRVVLGLYWGCVGNP